MKISKKEKYMLLVLISLLIIFLYHNFVYVKQSTILKAKKEEAMQIEEKYNKAMNDIQNLSLKEEELADLKNKVNDKAQILYPEIIQEKIILEIDKLLKENSITGNIGFSPIAVAPVERMVIEDTLNEESSLKDLVDKYDNKEQNMSSEDSTNSSEATDSQLTIQQLKITITFTSTYENLKKFIKAIEDYERKLVITNIAISSKSDKEISGSFNLEFYSVPKLSGQDEEYLEWTLNDTYGKENLFGSGNATGAYASTIEEATSEKDINDFLVMVKSSTSELPTLTIGKAKDDLRETYLTADNEKIEEATITLSEVDGKLYYKYNTSKSYYPEGSSQGKEFTPKSENIVIEITSESRVNTSDNSGLKLTINNNTNKNVEVIIKNDDKSNPRVSTVSKGNTVNVTKK